MDDALTDCTLAPITVAFKDWWSLGESRDAEVHAGMQRSAEWIAELNNDFIRDHAKQGYKITFTGHSLGAGTASLLAIHVRQDLPVIFQPLVKCFAFATPAVASRDLAEWSKSFVWSVVHDDDVRFESRIQYRVRMKGRKAMHMNESYMIE